MFNTTRLEEKVSLVYPPKNDATHSSEKQIVDAQLRQEREVKDLFPAFKISMCLKLTFHFSIQNLDLQI